MYKESTYLRQARNFIFENKFSREDFLANSPRQFSPGWATEVRFSVTTKKAHHIDELFFVVTHIRGTWKTVIEDLTRLSELLDDGEADNV